MPSTNTQEVMKELRDAQAVLGGVDDPKSAARAAALLEQVGTLEDFNALIANIKQLQIKQRRETPTTLQNTLTHNKI